VTTDKRSPQLVPDRLADALQQTLLFQGIDRELVQQLAGHAHRQTFAAGAIIFLEGDATPGFYFIEHGWIKIVKISAEGREQILQIWGPSDLFGGVTAFVDQPAPATAIALEATGLWLLPRHALHEHLLREPTFALRLIEFMAQRLSEMITLVSDLSLRSLTARLARRLLENAVDDVVARQRWATQAEMSARLGAAPDVVNRALRALVEEGIIELSRQQIRIVDHQRLQALAISER